MEKYGDLQPNDFVFIRSFPNVKGSQSERMRKKIVNKRNIGKWLCMCIMAAEWGRKGDRVKEFNNYVDVYNPS